MTNALTLIQTACAAFGRGDIPAQLNLLTDDVRWQFTSDRKAPGQPRSPAITRMTAAVPDSTPSLARRRRSRFCTVRWPHRGSMPMSCAQCARIFDKNSFARGVRASGLPKKSSRVQSSTILPASMKITR